MKVILSRKGMDSQYGGIPSPIIKSDSSESKFYSLPIPTKNSEIKYEDLVLYNDIPVSKFIYDVKPNYSQSNVCHLDPDIRESAYLKRPENWQRCFGQVKQAQSHLQNNGVGIGDVFLFFGWFQFAELIEGTFRYIKNSTYPNGFHAIYGYMQIDEIIKPNCESSPEWLVYHPHVKHKDKDEFNSTNNTVYLADNSFKYQIPVDKSGSGMFRFSDELILTQEGQDKRTIWQLPLEFHPDNGVKLTYNSEKNWSKKDEKSILNSASRGQEFIFLEDKGIAEGWCVNLIKKYAFSD